MCSYEDKEELSCWELEGNFFVLDFWLKGKVTRDQVINDFLSGCREVRITSVCMVLLGGSDTKIF